MSPTASSPDGKLAEYEPGTPFPGVATGYAGYDCRMLFENGTLAEVARPRARYTYYPGGSPVPSSVAPEVLNRPHSIEADVEIPPAGAERVLLAQGGGFTFFVKDGRLSYGHNYVDLEVFEVTAESELRPGRHRLRVQFQPTGEPDVHRGKGTPGRYQLYVDGTLVGARDVTHTTPLFFGLEGLSCGYDAGGSVLPQVYHSPFAFTGTIHEVVLDLSGDLIEDEESKLQLAMAQQ